MREICMEQPMIIVGGVLLLTITKEYDESQNEKLMNPATILEHTRKVEGAEAKAIEAPTTTTIDESPEETKQTDAGLEKQGVLHEYEGGLVGILQSLEH